MNSTFKQFNKLKIPLIRETIKIFENNDKLVYGETQDNLRDYKCCIVGSVRERLGLNKEYEPHNQDYCQKCVDLANQFPQPLEIYSDRKEYFLNIDYDIHFMERIEMQRDMKEQKERYEGLLLELKQHLKLDHNKELV